MASVNYKGIKHVVRIHTNFETRCDHCDRNFDSRQFAEAINHHLEQHGYQLLYVGPETTYFDKACHSFTVAILGK